MTGHKVDALFRFPFLPTVEVRASENPGGQPGNGPVIPFQETPDIVPEFSVPFLPAVPDKAAHLVETGGIPGFGDQLGAGQYRVGLNVPEDRGVFQGMAGFVAGEDGGEIEPEAVHVHLSDPVAEAVEDQTTDDRLIGVQGVPGAGVVGISGPVFLQNVVGVVLESFKTEGRSPVIAFGRVVIHHVEDHLDARTVKGLHHVPEFIQNVQGGPSGNCTPDEARKRRPGCTPSS